MFTKIYSPKVIKPRSTDKDDNDNGDDDDDEQQQLYQEQLETVLQTETEEDRIFDKAITVNGNFEEMLENWESETWKNRSTTAVQKRIRESESNTISSKKKKILNSLARQTFTHNSVNMIATPKNQLMRKQTNATERMPTQKTILKQPNDAVMKQTAPQTKSRTSDKQIERICLKQEILSFVRVHHKQVVIQNYWKLRKQTKARLVHFSNSWKVLNRMFLIVHKIK